MDAHKFIEKLKKIVEETGITELAFTVADGGGYDVTIGDGGVFDIGVFNDDDFGTDRLLIGGSEDNNQPDLIGGKNDLLNKEEG